MFRASKQVCQSWANISIVVPLKLKFNSIRSSCEELNASRGSLAQPFPYIRSKYPRYCKLSIQHVWCSSHAFARRILKNSPRIYYKETAAELTALRGSSEVVTRTMWYTSVHVHCRRTQDSFSGFLKINVQDWSLWIWHPLVSLPLRPSLLHSDGKESV